MVWLTGWSCEHFLALKKKCKTFHELHALGKDQTGQHLWDKIAYKFVQGCPRAGEELKSQPSSYTEQS